jgi:hypothetical protein
MKDTEQLELEYLRLANERDLHKFDEKRAHKNVMECQKKMQQLKRDIEGFEKENLNEKLLESALFIKQYCEETSCYDCMFYTSSGMYEECRLSGKSPSHWKKIKIER